MRTSHRLRLAAVGLLSFACAQSARTQRGIAEPREIEVVDLVIGGNDGFILHLETAKRQTTGIIG
jgi:hypothetical protein